jgi:hypothetical protein
LMSGADLTSWVSELDVHLSIWISTWVCRACANSNEQRGHRYTSCRPALPLMHSRPDQPAPGSRLDCVHHKR